MPAYKHWLIDSSLGDSFESLLEWEEIRVLIILWKRPVDSEKDDLNSLCQKEEKNCFRGNQVRGRTFTTKSKPRRCLVNTCMQNHPSWVCKAF